MLLILGLLLCIGSMADAQQTESAALVVVNLASGRAFRGTIDPRTDGEQLWIRCVYGQAVILRPVLWERIVSAEVAGKNLAMENFRELADRLKIATPRQPWPAAQESCAATALVLRPASFDGIPACFPEVRSLHATAHHSNWDADAQLDGLTVTLAPIDDHGALLPVEGTVEAVLYGYDRRSGLPAEHWSQLARWSQPITLGCYGPDGGRVRLPWDGALADRQELGSPGRVLRVRLQAPGHGTFEAEIPFLATRSLP